LRYASKQAAALVGIMLNLIFLIPPLSKFGVEERENINYD
jgi:hypothetical protein